MTSADPSQIAAESFGAASQAPIWAKADRLLQRLPFRAANAHGVVPLLVERLRERDEAVPDAFLQEERAAKMANAIAPSVLARARDAYDGRMMLLKGPEVSILYPGRARMLADLDLLVDDAPAAREALLASGFESADRLERVSPTFYHVNPVELPGVPLPIELHKSFRWPNGLRPAPNEELFEAAVPATVDVPGLVAPARAHHAVLLAVHAWAERPLGRLRDLIDVAVMADGIDHAELTQIAARWGWDRVWRATTEAIGWLFDESVKPTSALVWARHLGQLRDPTVVDRQLAYWLSPLWALPAHAALREIAFLMKKALVAPGQHHA